MYIGQTNSGKVKTIINPKYIQVPGSFGGIQGFQGTGAADFLFVQSISNNPGLIVERVAPLEISSPSWKIIQQIELQPYFARSLELKAIWTLLKSANGYRSIGCGQDISNAPGARTSRGQSKTSRMLFDNRQS